MRTNYNIKTHRKTNIMYAFANIFRTRYAFVSRREGTMPDAVGKRIRRLREKQGLTLRALATKAGVPISSISAVEQGTRAGARLSLETGKKLALAFGVTLDYLSGMHEELGQADEDAPPPPAKRPRTRKAAPVG
jgi:DNA-binding XRE family transcriptional regulator